jgi:hypothetical protein
MQKSGPRARRRTPGAEKKDDPRDSNKPIADHFYRCPACGALVDGRDREEMQLHHQHVLFPHRHDLRPASQKEEGNPNGLR